MKRRMSYLEIIVQGDQKAIKELIAKTKVLALSHLSMCKDSLKSVTDDEGHTSILDTGIRQIILGSFGLRPESLAHFGTIEIKSITIRGVGDPEVLQNLVSMSQLIWRKLDLCSIETDTVKEVIKGSPLNISVELEHDKEHVGSDSKQERIVKSTNSNKA